MSEINQPNISYLQYSRSNRICKFWQKAVTTHQYAPATNLHFPWFLSIDFSWKFVNHWLREWIYFSFCNIVYCQKEYAMLFFFTDAVSGFIITQKISGILKLFRSKIPLMLYFYWIVKEIFPFIIPSECHCNMDVWNWQGKGCEIVTSLKFLLLVPIQ